MWCGILHYLMVMHANFWPLFFVLDTLKFDFQLTSQPREDSEDFPGNFPSSDSGIQTVPLLWGCHTWCPRPPHKGKRMWKLVLQTVWSDMERACIPASLTRTQSHGPNLFGGWAACIGRGTQTAEQVARFYHEYRSPMHLVGVRESFL